MGTRCSALTLHGNDDVWVSCSCSAMASGGGVSVSRQWQTTLCIQAFAASDCASILAGTTGSDTTLLLVTRLPTISCVSFMQSIAGRRNPSRKLIRYGRLGKPGLWHLVHHHRPGVQGLPPRAA